MCQSPRQFDANPLMAIFKSTACLQSTEFNFEYVAIERGNSLHFSTSGCGAALLSLLRHSTKLGIILEPGTTIDEDVLIKYVETLHEDI